MSSVVISGDVSGSVTLQAPSAAGTTVLTLPAVTGTFITTTSGVAPGTAGNLLTSNGSAWVSSAPPQGARSGAAYATLSVGTPNITLTSSSSQLQIITATAEGQSITLPDATTMTLGSGYFVFYNTSAYAVAVKDAGGTVRELLYPVTSTSPIQAVSLSLQENATANGVWHIHNPINVINTVSASYANTSPAMSGANLASIIQVNGTQFVVVTHDAGVNNGAVYAKLMTVNTTTGALTFGSQVTLSSGLGAANFVGGVRGDSNGVDRGLICQSVYNFNQNTAVSNRIWGFAVVSNTLYISASTSTFTSVANGGMTISATPFYVANNNFFVFSNYDSGSSVAGNVVNADVRGINVGVSGTTVTLTTGSGGSTFTNQVYNTTYYCSPTSASTFVLDYQNGGVPRSISYNATTNACTVTTRTSQTTNIAGNLIPSLSSNDGKNLIIFNNNNQLIYFGSSVTVANAGGATVTVTANATYNYKGCASKSYSTVSASVGTVVNYVVNANSYYSVDVTNNRLLISDPPNNNFNFAGATFYGSPYWLNATQILFLVGNSPTSISSNLIAPGIPFVS